jgi:protein tyrosine phosphatase (PTP) superfamily phosphohydrolase (DUF442 family)
MRRHLMDSPPLVARFLLAGLIGLGAWAPLQARADLAPSGDDSSDDSSQGSNDDSSNDDSSNDDSSQSSNDDSSNDDSSGYDISVQDVSSSEPENDLPGLSNFAQVSDVLYRGAQPDAQGFQTLASIGIKTVVNFRQLHTDKDMISGTGLQYVEIPWNALHPETEDMLAFLKVVEDPANQPVFVHCQHGADRTGTAVATYRIVEEGASVDDAYAEMKRFNMHGVFGPILHHFLTELDPSAIQSQLDSTSEPKIAIIP